MEEPSAKGKTRGRLKVAFVSPRLAEAGAVGGAETLLFNLALLANRAGLDVEFLTTCAKSHFTWANELPAGETMREGVKVVRFPVNASRDADLFNSLQAEIGQGCTLSVDEEERWLANSVNSDALMDYAEANGFDRIVAGPYLFGLAITAARRFPGRTVLVPCLHDEPFARIGVVGEAFRAARSLCFNTGEEMALARRIFGADGGAGKWNADVVGFALDDFKSDAARGQSLTGGDAPYLLFCGRREPLKGTPVLIDYWAAYRKLHPGSKLKFVFTGSGEIERPEGLENDIIDLGFVSEQDKHDLMAGSLAFCHASVNESLGIVLLETWLARRPCLVTAAGAVLSSQVRAAHGGIWFANCAEFCEAVDFLLADPATASALGAAGREWTLANYSAAAVTARLSALLEQ